MRELVPAAAHIGLLVNPDNRNADAITRELVAKGSAMGLQINMVRASNASEIEAAFAVFVRDRVSALLVASDSLFFSERNRLVGLAARYTIPAVYDESEYAKAGRFEFVINLATARALGLNIAPSLLARADEVIE